MQRLIVIGLTLAMALSPSAASAHFRSAFGIHMQRCILLENASHTQISGVNVVYYNTHQTPVTEVDFLLHYRGGTYTLTDRGSFTNLAQINHTLTDPPTGGVWQGAEPELCTPGRVVFATGTVLQ
jgi:hypothetical protein